ncbi:MAG: MFS transporter [Novosphingobium sp.]|nr:MFS transporter [Novosphingobium sp.]
MREATSEVGRSAMNKALWRIVPLIALAYLCAYTDRVNVGFAAARMNADLGFSATVYGLGGGLFFLGYALFEVPSNLMAVRYGSRAWLTRIMITWGLLSAGMMFVTTPWQFYTVRFLLGVAEAGFYPGVIYYFSHWFPPCHRGRAVSRFYIASPLSSVLLGAVSGWLLALDGTGGLRGWQWLFLVQGLPTVLVGLAVWRWLPDRPADVVWLNDAEKAWITGELAREQTRIGPPRHDGVLAAMRNPRVLQLGAFGMLFIGAITTLILNAPLVLTAATGWTTGEVGWVVSLGGLIGAVVIIWAGNFADRRDSRFPDAFVHCVLLTLAFLVLALSSSAAVTIAAYLVFATVCFSIPMLTSSGWTEVLSVRELAVGAAAINTLSQIGAFVTPFAWGGLKDATGDYRAGLVLLLTLSVALTALLGWLCRDLRRHSAVVATA